MRRRLAALNARRAAAGLFVIDNGIGIATGEAVSGIAGSPDGRQVLSVIGEVTLIAEKLESASRHVGSRILLCQQTAAGVKNAAAMSDVTDLCGLPAFCLVADEVSDD
jgi:class 3 adenylate cyclase